MLFLAGLRKSYCCDVTAVVLVPVTLRQSFLEVHILIPTYQNAFILGPKVPYRVGFHFMTRDIGPQGPFPGVGLEVDIKYIFKMR